MRSAVDVASKDRQLFNIADFSQIERHDGGFAFHANAPHAAAFAGRVVSKHIEVALIDASNRFHLRAVKKQKIQYGSICNSLAHRTVIVRSPSLSRHLNFSPRNRANACQNGNQTKK